MRKVLTAITATLILASTSCDTTQPTGGGSQVITITASASGLVDVWQIWDTWADTDEPEDFVPDVKTVFHKCVLQPDPVSASVPWPYSAEITLIRAGTTDEIPLRSTVDDTDPFSSITPYDTGVLRTVPDAPREGRFYFLDGREVAATTRDYIDNCTNLGSSFGDSNIVGEPVEFSWEVEQGDTIVFRARKQLDAEANPYQSVVSTGVVLFSSYFVDGRGVTPAGTTFSASDGGGFTASVSTR